MVALDNLNLKLSKSQSEDSLALGSPARRHRSTVATSSPTEEEERLSYMKRPTSVPLDLGTGLK